MRLKLHEAEERFRDHEELFPLTQRTGTRRYFHGKPYVLEPEITLTGGLSPTLWPDEAIGEVTDSEWRGMRHREVGQAQAWYHPADRTLVIWECFLLDQYIEPDPSQDMTLGSLWAGFERSLLSRLPDAERIVTTWEDLYPRPVWQAFLESQGYTPWVTAVFAKPRSPSDLTRDP